MPINIYKDEMLKAYLFGTPVLFYHRPIPREDVPQGWYCYDLQGTALERAEHYRLVDKADKNHNGSVLSYLPLKNGSSKSRLVKGMFQNTGVSVTLDKFCSDEKICCPETPFRHMMCPASPEDAGLFYALPPEQDEKLGAIGHVRIDFGGDGKGFWHTWWPRGPEELNTQEFRDELDKVVNDLRQSVLKDLSSMYQYCYGSKGDIGGGSCCQNYGFTLETERYLYRLRCNPARGDYNAYLSCFDKQAQKHVFGLTEEGRQAIRDTADPSKAHSYIWYVIENINDPTRRIDHELPLEEAIQLYIGLDCADKRLGVDKDDIVAVDLAICWDGREWVSEDWSRSESFAKDPVIMDAVSQLRQMLEEAPAQSADHSMTMGGM